MYTLLTKRFALTVVSVVALCVQIHSNRISDTVENTVPPRAIGDAVVFRRAIEYAVSLQANLPARVDVFRAVEMTTTAMTPLDTVFGAACQRTV